VLRDSGASAQDKMPALCGGFCFMASKASRQREPGGSVQAERKKETPIIGGFLVVR